MKIGRIRVNGIAQNAAKICQWDLLKLSALKHFTESPMISSFRKAPVQRKAIMETYFLMKVPKVLLKFIDFRAVP